MYGLPVMCLTTVQNNTILKLLKFKNFVESSLTTVQNNTILKLDIQEQINSYSLTTVQNNTILKPQIRVFLRTTRRNSKRYKWHYLYKL